MLKDYVDKQKALRTRLKRVELFSAVCFEIDILGSSLKTNHDKINILEIRRVSHTLAKVDLNSATHAVLNRIGQGLACEYSRFSLLFSTRDVKRF